MSQTLIGTSGTILAYDQYIPEVPAGPGVIFMHGFQSDRAATKAVFMEALCRKLDLPFIRFDFFAHGESGGAWPDFTIGQAVHDALLVIDTLTEGPQIVTGSSMGGWVGLRLMEERPERVNGLVFVAPAPDFTAHVAKKAPLSPEDAANYTQNLLKEGANQLVMQEKWEFNGPIAILQGQKDDSVPWQTANAIQAKFPDPAQVHITFVPDGDHRLNRPEDLALLEACFMDVLNRI